MFDDDMSLFEEAMPEIRQERAMASPLAVRMRPTTLDEIVGQEKAVGKGTWLRSLIEQDKLVPLVLYGPPGVGKTTLAKVIARVSDADFQEVSAIGGGVSDLRRVIDEAEKNLAKGRKTILFVDEIHRFSKSQQDALLHAVEDRTVVLVGATTENPYFEVNKALLSRMRVVVLEKVGVDDLVKVMERALTSEKGLDGKFEIEPDAERFIAEAAGGDVRACLTTLDLAADIAQARASQGATNPDTSILISLSDAKDAAPRASISYDKDGDEHYDVISAFIKSMRGSDPDAAVYWLARMIDGGEDPKFIARRILICAAEDIGLADPMAVVVAQSAFRAAEVLGYPECRINLAEAAVYNALAPKSNSAYLAIDAALADVRENGQRPVPSYLRDRHRPGSGEYGIYKYPHEFRGHWCEQRYLPEGLDKGAFFDKGELGWEGGIEQH